MAKHKTMTYAEKLKDPRWQKKRLTIMSRDNFKCVKCGTEDKMLSVHHGYYERGKEPWEYPDKTLHTLCSDCHTDVGEKLRDIYYEIASIEPDLLECLMPRIMEFKEEVIRVKEVTKKFKEEVYG